MQYSAGRNLTYLWIFGLSMTLIACRTSQTSSMGEDIVVQDPEKSAELPEREEPGVLGHPTELEAPLAHDRKIQTDVANSGGVESGAGSSGAGGQVVVTSEASQHGSKNAVSSTSGEARSASTAEERAAPSHSPSSPSNDGQMVETVDNVGGPDDETGLPDATADIADPRNASGPSPRYSSRDISEERSNRMSSQDVTENQADQPQPNVRDDGSTSQTSASGSSTEVPGANEHVDSEGDGRANAANPPSPVPVVAAASDGAHTAGETGIVYPESPPHIEITDQQIDALRIPRDVASVFA